MCTAERIADGGADTCSITGLTLGPRLIDSDPRFSDAHGRARSDDGKQFSKEAKKVEKQLGVELANPLAAEDAKLAQSLRQDTSEIGDATLRAKVRIRTEELARAAHIIRKVVFSPERQKRDADRIDHAIKSIARSLFSEIKRQIPTKHCTINVFRMQSEVIDWIARLKRERVQPGAPLIDVDRAAKQIVRVWERFRDWFKTVGFENEASGAASALARADIKQEITAKRDRVKRGRSIWIDDKRYSFDHHVLTALYSERIPIVGRDVRAALPSIDVATSALNWKTNVCDKAESQFRLALFRIFGTSVPPASK
jgi:hypothetical protein